MLHYGDVRFIRKRRGSTIITLELTADLAEKLLWAVKSGEFEDLEVHDATIIGIREILESRPGDSF